MIIFPFQWVILDTDLTVSETELKLKKSIAGNPGFLNSSFHLKGDSHFLGTICEDSFYLKRISTSFGQSITPLIFGKIRNNGNNTEIKLFIRIHVLRLIIFLLIIIGFSWASYEIYQFENRTGSNHKGFQDMLLVTISFYLLIVAVFKYYSYKAINELKFILEGKIKKNTF